MYTPVPDYCPVCLASLTKEKFTTGEEGFSVDCPTCKRYIIHEDVWDRKQLLRESRTFDTVKRAALSHSIAAGRGFPLHPRHRWPMLTQDAYEAFLSSGATLPVVTQQARNLVRIVGDRQRTEGKPACLGIGEIGLIGCVDYDDLMRLIEIVGTRGWIEARGDGSSSHKLRLTMAGWEVWEQLEKEGLGVGFGVIAMQFGNADLDRFVNDVVRPAVASIPGCTLHRIDDPAITRAGVIDNIMRQAIRDAAFVIADLSHGNNGAYWEAGFAEGLGKPVIYLCEKSLWEERRTHFDTNHCTTVVWDPASPDEFARSLVATLRNSIGRPK